MASDNIPIKVRKNTGELVDFDMTKLRAALARSGADNEQIESVLQKLLPDLHDGITTHNIYQKAYKILKKISWRAAGRYRLKKAMLELGPSGYPFEHFVAKLLQFEGYEVLVGQLVQGRCVTHEVDVVASRPGEKLMVECKYHSDNSSKSDVKVSLYINSRFQDIMENWKKLPENHEIQFEGMLITNSRFTQDALQYGKCAGLKMISWDYPSGNSLRDWIDRSGYHPVTALQTLNRSEKQALLQKGYVLCRQVTENPDVLKGIVTSPRKINNALREIESLVK